MSTKTVIGGTTYETVGSSTSNLLLKCNGTARIQWGTKLIDLIKNGKIVSENSSEQIFKVSDKSEMSKDGIYIITKDDSSELWVYKNGESYSFTGADLYISASTKQDITVEQQKQALENLGIYYNTLEEAEASGIQNGLVYIIDTKQLYTVKDGKYEEFQATLKTVTVEKETEEGEVISSSVKVVLSVLDKEYLILSDQRIVANYPIHVKNHVQLGSENANELTGYRLYFQNGKSCLDVDTINVRQGIPVKDYTETTFTNLESLISQGALQKHQWYLITDFQNHWKISAQSADFNRPILVQALTGNSLYKEGLLFNNQSVVINYDISYKPEIVIEGSDPVTARGKITWMRDWNNNEADFDFLDYTDVSGNALTTLHQEQSYLDRSIFPKGSFNNKLKTENLRGTVLNEGMIDNTNTTIIDFRPELTMHGNVMTCKNFVIDTSCTQFVNNSFDCVDNVTITADMSYSTFKNVVNCSFLNSFESVRFKNIVNCNFEAGVLSDIVCHSDLSDIAISSTTNPLLYDESTFKEICFRNEKICYIGGDTQAIPRGIIVMHSGLEEIPYGWAICDGNTYEYDGVETQTPNLVDRFIKATSQISAIGPVDNSDLNASNEFTLQLKHLPEHSHPHQEHTHGISDVSVDISNSGVLEMEVDLPTTSSNQTSVVSGEGLETGTTEVIGDLTSETTKVTISGGDHTHTCTVSQASISPSTSEEAEGTWENSPIKIEPNYYSLIFIMKL